MSKPCIRCGDCCESEQCKMSLSIYGKRSTCPALIKNTNNLNQDKGNARCYLYEIAPDAATRCKMQLLMFLGVGICTNDFKYRPNKNA